MKDHGQLSGFASNLSVNARKVVAQLFTMWPHDARVGVNEICFMNEQGVLAFRVFHFGGVEKINVHRHVIANLNVRNQLIASFAGVARAEGLAAVLFGNLTYEDWKKRPVGSVEVSLNQLSAQNVPALIRMLDAGRSARNTLRLCFAEGEAVH
jgi:hypothetical protein